MMEVQQDLVAAGVQIAVTQDVPQPPASSAASTMTSSIVADLTPQEEFCPTELWLRPLLDSLQPYSALRGGQVQEVLATSQCTGLCSESMVYKLCGIDHKILWTCDPKGESHHFSVPPGMEHVHPRCR